MEVNNCSPYLPKSRIIDLVSELKTNVAYRVWKRKLKRYGGFNKNTNFKLLEIGCGPGYFLRCMEKWFPESETCGLDIDESLLKFASSHIKKTKLIAHDGQILPFPDNSYDVVCCLQVIEHLKDPSSLFEESSRVLKTNGFLVISTPNPTGIPAKALKKRWQGYRYDHISLKTPQQWQGILLDSGFQIIEDGTTGLTGFKILQKLPFAIFNWIPMATFGYFPWSKGESYMAIAKKI